MNSNNLERKIYYPEASSPVRYYWQIYSNSNTPTFHTVLPSPYFQMIFPLNMPIKVEDIPSPVSDPFISPILESAKTIELPPASVIFGIHINPSFAYSFFKHSPTELIKNANSMEEVLNNQLFDDLKKIIFSIADFNIKVNALELLLKSYSNDYDPLLLKVVNRIITDPQIRINTLAGETGYSERWIQKKFTDKMGINPQKFLATVRFNLFVQSLYLYPKEKLTTLAYRCGYFDQAHSIKEFKKFASYAPGHFFNKTYELNTVLNRN